MSLPSGDLMKLTNKKQLAKAPFLFFQSHPDDYKQIQNNYKQAQIQSAENKLLHRVFFDEANVKIIQSMLVRRTYDKSGNKYLIGPQNPEHIRLNMDTIWSQYEYDNTKSIQQQILELDNLIVDKLATMILSYLSIQNKYMNDAFGSRQLIDLPKFTINSKTLPSLQQF